MKLRGQTLVEVLIGMALFSIVMSAAFAILAPGIQNFRSGLRRADQQQALLLAMRRMTHELEHSDMLSLVILLGDQTEATEGNAMTFLSGRDDRHTRLEFSTDGFVVFRQHLVYYLGPDTDGSTALFEQREPLASPDTAARRLQAFTPNASRSRRLVADVVAFTVRAPLRSPLDDVKISGLRANPVFLKLVARHPRGQTALETNISLRQNLDLSKISE